MISDNMKEGRMDMKHTKKTALIAVAFTIGLAMTGCTNSGTQKDVDSAGTETKVVDADKETEDMDNPVGIYAYYGPSRSGYVK